MYYDLNSPAFLSALDAWIEQEPEWEEDEEFDTEPEDPEDPEDSE